MDRRASSEEVARAWYCLALPAANAAASCAPATSSRSSRTSLARLASLLRTLHRHLKAHSPPDQPIPDMRITKPSRQHARSTTVWFRLKKNVSEVMSIVVCVSSVSHR